MPSRTCRALASRSDKSLIRLMGNRLFERVTAPHASADGMERELKLSLPFGKAKRLAFVCEQFRGASITRLDLARFPTAITRFVGQFVVKALKGMGRSRLWSHIRDEVFEASPSRVVRNASASVVDVGPTTRLIASALHVLPSAVFACVRVAVRSTSLNAGFALETTTGARITRDQAIGTEQGSGATVAFALPASLAIAASAAWSGL
jgi:hypothetical protein